MKLNKLPKTTTKSKKRVGRGYGSGKGGHTVGRGQKGQKSRSKVGLLFEGTKMRKSLIKRMPMRRGKGKLKSWKTKAIILNVKYLNYLKDGSEVTIESLIKNNLVVKEARKLGVKILGDGNLGKKLIVKVPVSKGAEKKIKKAGGKVAIGKVEKVKPDGKKATLKRLKKQKTLKKPQKVQKLSVTKKASGKKKPKKKTKSKKK